MTKENEPNSPGIESKVFFQNFVQLPNFSITKVNKLPKIIKAKNNFLKLGKGTL